MMDPPPCSPNAPALNSDDDAPLCPQCGYDLRGSDSGRCSECGLEIDRATLLVSSIPWARRRRIGRKLAYLWTFWLVTIGSRKLRHEASKPQSLADARRFQWITAGWVAFVFVGVFIAAVLAEGGFASMAIQPEPIVLTGSVWWHDLSVPWCAGATIPPVMPIALAFFAWASTSVPRQLLRAGIAGPKRRERAEALALYTTAPLLLLVPAAMLAGLALLLQQAGWLSDSATLALVIPAGILEAAALLLTLARVAQWRARVKHSAMAGLFGVPLLLILWSLAGIVTLGILPWCIGFLWIVIDSFR